MPLALPQPKPKPTMGFLSPAMLMPNPLTTPMAPQSAPTSKVTFFGNGLALPTQASSSTPYRYVHPTLAGTNTIGSPYAAVQPPTATRIVIPAAQSQTNPSATPSTPVKRGRGRPPKNASSEASSSSPSRKKKHVPRYRCRYGCGHSGGFDALGLKNHMGNIHGLFPASVHAKKNYKTCSMCTRAYNKAKGDPPCANKVCCPPVGHEAAMRSVQPPRKDSEQEIADTFAHAKGLTPRRLVLVVQGDDEVERRAANRAAIACYPDPYIDPLEAGANTYSTSRYLKPSSSAESPSSLKRKAGDAELLDYGALKRLKSNDSAIDLTGEDADITSAALIQPAAYAPVESDGLPTKEWIDETLEKVGNTDRPCCGRSWDVSCCCWDEPLWVW